VTTSRGVGRRIALAAAATLVAFGVCELALRLALGDRFSPLPPARRVESVIGRHDAEIGWSLVPNASAHVIADRLEYDVTLNSRGYRDVERGPRRKGVRRTALLGDSFAFGWGVEADETFARRLEDDPRVGGEVVNLCVPGYSTDQELWVLERECAWVAPDLVLVQFCPNDVEGAATTNSHRMLKPMFVRLGRDDWTIVNRPTATFMPVVAAPPSWGDRTFSWSALWQIATGRTPLVATDAMPRATSDVATGDPFAPDAPVRHAFELLVAKSRALGAKLAVFGAPPLNERVAPPVVEDGAEFLYDVNQRLLRLGKEIGFATLSVDRAMHDARASGVVVVHVADGHWNATGHRIVAEALAPQIERLFASAPK